MASKQKQQSGLLFCPYSGSLLQFDPLKNIAVSQLSGYSKSLNGTS